VEVIIITDSHKVPAESLKREGNVRSLGDWQGIMHQKFIPEGAMVSMEGHKEVLICLQDAVYLRHPKIWVAKDGCFCMIMHWHFSCCLCNSPSTVLSHSCTIQFYLLLQMKD
jgi:hypothetical protein